jgi:hypothetical protein
MMCGDINQSHVFKNLPMPAYFGTIEGIKNLYLVFLVLNIIPFYFLMNRSHFNMKTVSRRSKTSLAVKSLVLLISFGLVTSIYTPTLRVIVPFSKTMEKKLSSFLSQFKKSAQKRTAFEKDVNLRESFFDQGEELNTVLIRVNSEKTPGYMRSRVYEEYFDGNWKSAQELLPMVLLNEEHEYSHSTFSFAGQQNIPDKKELEEINIYYSGNFIVSNILYTGKTKYLEMTCELLNQTPSGTVTGRETDFSGGITLYNDKSWGEEDPFPSPEMSPALRNSYLQIDSREDYGLKKELLERFKLIVTDTSSADAIAASIKTYFNQTFEYKLGTSVKGSVDPILTFLRNGKGHCELFATTTVMALRSYNVPARYVTGFYCSEPHPSGNYFIGRSRDLHAWVEYYDDKSATWKLLEPTPPGAMPNSESKFNWFSSLWDNVVNRWNALISSVVRGYFAETVLIFLGSILDILIWCFNAPLRALISLSLIFLFFYRRNSGKLKENYSKEFLLLRKDLDKTMAKIKKIKDFKLNPSSTLSEIARQIELRQHPNAEQLAACVREYETLRFCEAQRSDDRVREVKKKFSAALKAGIR